ncbi:MAG: LysR family transcriptional regulator, partial [Pseudomonadota bacterium]
CNDLISGALDIGILYSPRPLPDLYFESLGEVRYVMVSTNAPSLDYVVLRQYVLGNFAPAFASQHAALYPALSTASLTVGQSAVIAGVFRSIGGTGYVLEDMANTLLDADLVRIVDGAEVIPQMVYGAMHMRNRHRGLYRRVMRALGQQVLQT